MREAQNISRFHKNFEEDPRVVIPKVCWECSGRRVLAMTYLKGVPLNDMERLKETGWDLKKFGRTGVDAFLKMVFVHGYFHGDIHGGNVLAMAEEQIGLIDFGVVGQLDRRLLEDASGLFIALVQRDWRAVARAYVRISSFAGDTAAIDRFARDLSDVLDPLMGLSLKQIDSARVLVQLLEVANRHHVRVPQDLLLLFRALASLDTIGRELDPDFDVVSAATPFAKDLLTDRFRPERLTIDLVSALRDLADMGRDLPAQMQNIVRRVDQGSLTIEARVKDPRMMQIVRREGWRVSSALLTGSGGVMLALTQAQESLGVGGWLGLTFVIAGLLGFWVTVLQRRK